MSRITIIIPCFNEEERLPLQDYRRFLSKNEINILFIDDGSTDRTMNLLELLQKEFSAQVKILSMNTNVGKAEAVRRGILATEEFNRRDIIGYMDADLATPLEEIFYFLNEFKNPNIQFVFGARFSRIGAKIKRFHHRHYFGRVVATLVSLYLRIPIYDSQCGAKFFHVGFARQLFMTPFVSRWLFDVEIFRRIALLNIKITDCALELPLHTWIEKGGSKIRIQDYAKLPIEFCKIVLHYLKEKRYSFLFTSPERTLIATISNTRT
jgi:glycosyltransferase involved in cell wall biosynthesis